MALTLDAHCDDVLTLEEYVSFIEQRVHVEDADSLAASAPALRALLNNRRLFTDLIDRELASWQTFQEGNSYIGRTLILARRENFFVRANMWLPHPASADSEFEIAHDHNFAFMTGGYMGPGYATTLYEIDPKGFAGLEGERVDLNFVERTHLPQGKIMLYRAAEDVHYQGYPSEFSVSINLVVPGVAERRAQHFFDVSRGTVTRRSYDRQGRALALCELAKFVGGETTASLLSELSQRSENPYLRAGAFDALRTLAPEAAEELQPSLQRDRDAFVRACALR